MGSDFKVALTHDVDRTEKTFQYFSHFWKGLMKSDLNRAFYQIFSFQKRKEVFWNFEEIIGIENKYNVKSTFFFLIESIPFNLFEISNWKLSLGRYDIRDQRIISMVQYLNNNGWEVGLHGSYRSYKDADLLKKEKTLLQEIIGHPLSGVRQHYLNLNEKTWFLQREVGFKYDSSWGYTRAIGFKENRINPFHPFNDNFTVFPLAIMDFCYMNTADRKILLNSIIRQCKENKSILVINWHNDVFNENESPGYKKAYCEIIETCYDNNAIFNTLADFYSNYQR